MAATELLRFATAGSVDDGKSTLIGRLLYDTKSILQDQLEQLGEASVRRHGQDGGIDLSLLTDGLRAEREQGITIDVAYRYFATPRRRFIIADTPGHVDYTRNMVTGASTADLAVVLIDARNGITQQSRRHAFISSLLRIPHMVVCVNKMDLVDWSEERFAEIVQEFSDFAAKLEVVDISFIPVSALSGDNVATRSTQMAWYDGSPLLYHLENVHIASDRNLIDPRLPVQWVIRPGGDEHHDYRAFAGQVAGGVFRVGDPIIALPSGARSSIAAIDSFDGPLAEAFPPLSVALRLSSEIDVSRGDLICRQGNQPTVSRDIEAIVCWMDDRPAQQAGRYLIKHTTRTTSTSISEIDYRIDVDTLHRDTSAKQLGLNEIGRLRLRTSSPLVFDRYDRNRATGSFVLIDEATNNTVAAGMIIGEAEVGAEQAAQLSQRRTAETTWEPESLTREQRWATLGTRGATIWFTGLPASGKSSIAAAVERTLVESGRSAYRLDGDNLRHGLTGDLGFSAEDRAENVRRAAAVAAMLADAGVISLVSLVSPYAADRARARELHELQGIEFLEVFVDTPLETCEQRDPKGLYARARSGELTGMTGVDAPYERPARADLVLLPDDDKPLVTLLELLSSRGLIELDEG
jgi:bifunctional enzyme CysN/CysC